jgi:hypothetical protein
MNEPALFSYSNYEEQTHLAECELTAFIKAVTESLGPEQAGVAMEDWLEEADLTDAPPLSIGRNWHSVTIAASARLPNQVGVRSYSHKAFSDSADTKVSFIPSFNCLGSTLLG